MDIDHLNRFSTPPHTPLNSRFYMKKIGPGVSEEKLFKEVDGWTMMDNGRQVIRITHPEPSDQAS